MSEKEVLSSLLTDPKETLNRLVSKSDRVFKINRETGDVVLLPPRSRFPDRQLLAIYLLGRYFASKLELTPSDMLTLEDLKKISGLDEGSISARLSELKKEGLVETIGRGSYRVSYSGLEGFGFLLEEIERGGRRAPVFEPTKSRGQLVGTVPADINFANVSDAEAVMFALYTNGALPGSDKSLTGDEIFEWVHSQGGFLRKDTLKKYTLPQDPVLKARISKARRGRENEYQLLRPGLEKVKRLLGDEAPGKS